jgi:2-aminoethylphosphonate-pyruvate transaminase
MKLLIPGPVSTDARVRAAMGEDYAPWDNDFRTLTATLPAKLLALAGGISGTHVALPLPGSGHFAVEAALRAVLPPGGRILVPMVGHYAESLARLAERAGRLVTRLAVPPMTRAAPEAVRAALAADPGLSHLAIVYNETSSGIAHDLASLAGVAAELGRRVLVDAISSFGALPLDLAALPNVDAAVFTINKCLEAPPGLSFVLARQDSLPAGQAGSWSLDLADVLDCAQRAGWGVWRFTPPAPVVAACAVALDLLIAEGGPQARLGRYTANMRVLYEGMESLGLTPTLPPGLQGPIVMNVHAPADPAWDLQRFVDVLKRRGFLISNFAATAFPSFRVGCIGALTQADMQAALAAIDAALSEIGVRARGAKRAAA